MDQVAIEFRALSKSFTNWENRPSSIKAIAAQLVTFSFEKGEKKRTHVLNNLNFKINKGEFVGLLGRNGVGKSTLLKLISQIYHPTEGQVVTVGRIAPLLELGAGFAPELNGFENIYLNASILGFGRKAIEEKISSIVNFCELGADLHRPVRNYSSGMLVRLGFAIASHLDADILLFDEVLAVGDVGFQKKCLERIYELHSAGKTIVLVSHSMEQISMFCKRSIVIDQGGVVFDGAPKDGINKYNELFGVEQKT
jgi:ABC-type polysaccharide/polyol phosphate transport system ATPase subunit